MLEYEISSSDHWNNSSTRVGEYNRKEKEGTEEDYQVAAIFRHRKYDPFTTDSDIALMKLARPVKYNKYVSPVCLPSRDPPVGTECYVTGKMFILIKITQRIFYDTLGILKINR